MADETPKDEKTEAPTPHRREEAKRKGDRLSSRELSTALAGAAGALWIATTATRFVDSARASMADSLSFTRLDLIDFRPIEALIAGLWPLALPLLLLALLTVVAAILGQAGTGGIGFSSERLNPDWSRLNPVAGIGRLFGIRGLVELLKAVAKAALLAALAWWTLRGALPLLGMLAAMAPAAAIRDTGRLVFRLSITLTLGLALIGAIDLPVQIRLWLQRLRMTKQDVKEEMKQQEGSPEVKHALRRMARETLKRANREAVSDATVVLTNPTHFAVALRYRPALDSAPVIVARGRGVVAEAIRELAHEKGIPVLSYPSVARAIYFTGRVGTVIRADLYGAVATILAFVLRVDREGVAPPEAEAPEGARFDEFGRPL